MNVIILLSGSSIRFFKKDYKVPKFLIKVDGKSILNYIISNFDTQKDNFIFICRKDFFYNKNYNIEKNIKKLCKKYKIYLIDPHKLGPVYSLIKFSDKIKKLKNVIVNYCDFFWIWDYDNFKSWLKIKEVDAAALCYKGFHPHYINPLKFAYVKARKNQIIRVKEKESFTNNRENEPAMSGTFYFKSGEKLIDACNKMITNKDKVKNEYYVSLLFNYLYSKKQYVYLTDYFFQWGTPNDLHQYMSWQENLNINKKVNMNSYQNILMMAGKGKRLSKIQNIKKPFIELENKFLMYEYLNSNILTNKKKALINGDNIDYKNLNLKNYEPIAVGKTKNQLNTLEKFFDKNLNYKKNFFISPCDCKVYFKYNNLSKLIKNKPKFDIIVFTFDGYEYANLHPSQFGWIKKHNNNKIKKFLHKPKKNNLNTEIVTGFFLFNKNLSYKNLIDEYFQKNNHNKFDHSIDMFVDYLNKKKYNIYYLSVKNFLCLGTEKEYLIYDYWKKAHKKIKFKKN